MRRRAENRRDPLRPEKGESGFTFVEIMLALAVGAIVIVGMYQAFNTLHKWWIATGVRSEMRQNARAGLETLTRDIEMAGYQTTSYGDVRTRPAWRSPSPPDEIEMDQQRPDNDATIGANPVYEPQLVYYHLATDMKTGRQNLYRQIRAQPGLPSHGRDRRGKCRDFHAGLSRQGNNNPVDCLTETFNGKLYGEYTVGTPRPLVDADYCRDPVAPCASRVPCDSGLRPRPAEKHPAHHGDPDHDAGRRHDPRRPAAAGAATLTVDSTARVSRLRNDRGLPDLRGNRPRRDSIVTCTGKDATHFTGVRRACPAAAAGNVVARPMPIGTVPKALHADGERACRRTWPRRTRRPRTASRRPLPTGLAVVDTRSCSNKLHVSWNNPDDLDLAGYLLFYGPTGHSRTRSRFQSAPWPTATVPGRP